MSHIKRHFLVDKIAHVGYTINTLKKGVIEMTVQDVINNWNEATANNKWYDICNDVNTIIRSRIETIGLGELCGSEKQIKYAASIREKTIEYIAEFYFKKLCEIIKLVDTDLQKTRVKQLEYIFNACADFYHTQTSAKYFIERGDAAKERCAIEKMAREAWKKSHGINN